MSRLDLVKMFKNENAETFNKCSKAYEKGRTDELNKINNMIWLGCEESSCDECDYRLYSQDVCQQAYTFGVIENYIAEQLKEK